MQIRWKASAGLLLVTIMLGTLAGCIGQTEEPEEIRIGIIVPLTGPVAYTGDLQKKGAELAAKEINEAGGILGKQVKLFFGDTESKPDAGVSVFKRLVDEDKVDLICGGIHSDVALALMDQAATYEIPYLSMGPSSDALTDKYKSDPEKYWMYYRCTPLSTDAYGLAWKEFLDFVINEKGWWTPHNQKYSILVEHTAFGETNGDAFDDYMSDWGWEQVGYEMVPADESDYFSVLTKIKTADPSVLLTVQTSAAACASLTKQFREQQIDALFLSVFVASLGAYKDLAGSDATGVLWNLNSAIGAKLALGDPKATELADAFRAEFGEEPIGNSVGQWEQLYLIKAAYEAAGNDALTDARAFCDAFGTLDVTLVDRYQFLPEHLPRWGAEFRPSLVAQIREGTDYNLWPPAIAKEPSWETPPWITE